MLIAATGRTWSGQHAFLFLAAGWLAAGLFEGGRLATEIAASRRRMGDPMYRAYLVRHGIQASRAALEGR